MNSFRFEDITVGMKQSFQMNITEEAMDHFLAITGDENPLHRDPDFARMMGYENTVVYGMLTASLFSTLAGVYLPGERSVIRKVQADFPKPVFVGDTLDISGEVTAINDRFGYFEMKTMIRNQKGEKVCRGKMEIGFLEEK